MRDPPSQAPAGAGDAARHPPRRAIRSLVAAIAAGGALSTGLILHGTWSDGIGDGRVLAVAVVGLALVNVFPIVFEWRGEAEHVSLDEAGYVLLAMAAPAPAAVVVMLAVNLGASLYHRRPLVKTVFNLGTWGIAVPAALLVTGAVAGSVPGETSLRGLAGAALGGVTLYAVTTLAVRVVVALSDGIRFGQLFAFMNAFEITMCTAAVTTGLLAGLAASTHPFAALLVFPPIGVLAFVLAQHAAAVRNQQRLDLLLKTAVAAQAAESRAALDGIVIEAVGRLLHSSGVSIERGEHRPPGTRGVITSPAGVAWVAASETDGQRVTASEQELVDGVTAIAATALGRLEAHEALEARVLERTRELEEANRELDAFSYSVSHDLVSPLRGIDGLSHILLEDYASVLDADGRRHLESIRAAVRRMAALIDDLLALARLSRQALRPAPTDLTAMAEAIVADLRRNDPDRRVEVRIEPGLTADADPGFAEVALRNLFENAWKFTGRSAAPRISLSAAPAPGWFCVEDNGDGFDPAVASRLFQPFQRLHRASDFPGTGVGLATVRRILVRHGGQIRAHAEPGRGACFAFTFAATDSAPEAEALCRRDAATDRHLAPARDV